MNWKKLTMKLLLALSILSIIIPILSMILWSFTNNYIWPDIMPTNFGTRGWEYVIQNSDRVIHTLKNSIFISLMTTIITVAISIPCAKALAFENFKGKKFVEMLVFSPVIIPPVSIGMGLNIEFIKMGLAGTYLGIILVSIVPCIP